MSSHLVRVVSDVHRWPAPHGGNLPGRSPRPGDRLGLATTSIVLVTSAVFCVLLASLLTLVAPELAGFPGHLLYAQCIGLSIVALGVALPWLPGFTQLSPRWRGPATIALAGPIGYLLGRTLAAALRGDAVSPFDFGGGRAIGVLAATLGSAFIGYLLVTRASLVREERARQHAQNLATQAQLRLLRAQLDPHMLFNTLANLHALVDEDASRAKEMIERLIALLRGSLSASRGEWSTLRQEFDLLEHYLELMRMRLGPRLSCGLELPDALTAARFPALMLQPLVENAIRHGIEPKLGAGRIEVRAQSLGDRLVVTVADDGVGLAGTQEPASKTEALGPCEGTEPFEPGYGLSHVRERLEALYGNAAELTLAPAASGTGVCATVRMPL